MILLGGPVYVDTKYNTRMNANDLDISEYDPDAAAAQHVKLGYKAAYAPYIPTKEASLIKKTEKAFKKHGVILAEMGYWKNLQCMNEYQRMQNIEMMCETLASADEMGALCTVNTIGLHCFGGITEEFNAYNMSDDFFDEAVENARYIIDKVNPKRTKFTYENFAFTALDSIEQMEKMVKAVDRPAFGVHLDATNLVTSVRKFFSFNDLVEESFKRFGDKIVACHIKDLKLIQPASHIEIREVAPGEGMLDMAFYLNEISRQTHGIPTMLEHLPSEEDYDKARGNIASIAKASNIKF